MRERFLCSAIGALVSAWLGWALACPAAAASDIDALWVAESDGAVKISALSIELDGNSLAVSCTTGDPLAPVRFSTRSPRAKPLWWRRSALLRRQHFAASVRRPDHDRRYAARGLPGSEEALALSLVNEPLGGLLQTDVVPGVIDPLRVAIVRGRVSDREENPVFGVRVTVKDHPELGATLSRDDGAFDLAQAGALVAGGNE